MADDKGKKTKIDLKARLGKSSTLTGMNSPGPMPMPVPGGAPMPGMVPDSGPGGGAGSVPPPGGVSGTPVPAPKPPTKPASIAPPPGITAGMSPGIPLPPFAPQSRPQAAAPKPTAAQQTIKVEIGEEIEQERKKAKRNTGIAAALAAVLGIAIGFPVGSSSSSSSRIKEAAAGAGRLELEVKKANDKMAKLATSVEEGLRKLQDKTFPDDLAAALGTVNIPFDSTNLEGKYVGSLPTKKLRSLLAYTSAVEDVNASKDKIKNLLGQFKEPITKLFKEEKEPMANFAVIFRGEGEKKTVAELWSIKAPFAWKTPPDTFEVTKTDSNGKPSDKKVTRWVKGDLTGSDAVGIPVDSRSPVAIGAGDGPRLLRVALLDVSNALAGINHDDPGHEKLGLLKDGENLVGELHQVCSAEGVCPDPKAEAAAAASGSPQ